MFLRFLAVFLRISRDADEYSKFVPHKLPQYEIVANGVANTEQYYQRKASFISTDIVTDHVAERRGMYRQIASTCAVLLLSAACGMPIGYSAVILPQLSDKNTTEIFIDVDMGSWIASVHSLATPFGSFLSGPMVDYMGRRTTLLVSVIPIFVGWFTLAIAQSYPTLIIGRLICGFATGLLGGPAQVYIAETVEPNLRSLLIGAPTASYSIGILIVFTLGSTMHWRGVAWCGNILPALATITIFCIPESPVWLLRNKRMPEALKSLIFLRGGNEIVAQKELNEMNERLCKEQATTKTNENIFQLCCQRVAIKPLVIVIVFAFLQMCSGTFLVVFYAIDIISEFGADFDTKAAAIWTAAVRMLCTLIFCFVLLFVRRRRILILSGIGSGLSCLILSIYLYVRAHEPKSNADVMVAAICVLSYIAANTALMVMPGIMIGELFPAKIRGRTAGGIFAAMNVSLFGLTKAFPFIQAQLKMRGVFMIFAISSFLVSLFMFMFQPETKGRSLQEIEDYFNENNWLWFRRDKSYKKVCTVKA